MKEKPSADAVPLCPSCQPEMEGARVFGIVGGSVEGPRLGYLDRTVPVNSPLVVLPPEVKPTEVFRMAAPCATKQCQHFDGTNCQLAKRIIQILPAVVDALPACNIRAECRWWQQEGRAACMRCPQVVTHVYNPAPELIEAAGMEPRT
jgi:hypothetical protein